MFSSSSPTPCSLRITVPSPVHLSLPGFGLAVVVVPLLLVVFEPKTVVALVAVLSLSVAAAVVRDSRREADRRCSG